jgi:deubiquitinating protein VCIP135
MATLKGRDLWTHVQTMPHLFSVGGLFYKQVERDLGLVDGKHCTLPTLPGKVL